MLANQLSPPDTRPPSNQRLLSARFKIAIVIFFHFMLKITLKKQLIIFVQFPLIFIQCIILVLMMELHLPGPTYLKSH